MKAVDFVRKMQAGGVAFVGSGIDEEKKRIIIQALSIHHHLIVIYDGEEDFNNEEVKFTDSDRLPTHLLQQDRWIILEKSFKLH
jgi:hypothetical protein